jgi:hypothetical protein
MKLEKVIKKIDSMQVENIVLDYDGCGCWFESMDELEAEAEQYELLDEEVKSYKLKNGILSIVM